MPHEHIKLRIREHSHLLSPMARESERERCELLLLEFILSEIAEARRECHGDLVNQLHRIGAEIKKEKEQLMIAQSVFDASLKALTDAVANVTSGVPSTPDSVVQSFITGVDTNTQHLLAGSGTPPPPPPPTP